MIFILLDSSEQEKDLKLAKHIAKVHQNKRAPETAGSFPLHVLRNYIALCKDYSPKISSNLTNLLVDKYVKKRIYYSDLTKKG